MLDTSAVLRLHELEVEDLPEGCVITTITQAELAVGPLLTDDDVERAARLAHVQAAEADYGDPLSFDVQAARALAQVAVDFRRSGRKPQARAFDALIAATAKSRQLPRYTFNAEDFSGITGLEVVPLPPSGRA